MISSRTKEKGFFWTSVLPIIESSSNTWYLESRLGWSGIAVDAQESYRPGYERHRPRTRFFAVFVSDRSNETARLFISGARSASSSARNFANAYGGVKTSVDVPTITLNDLLVSEGVERFDFLSMDIELAEPAALAGLDIRRFHPGLVVVEAHPQVRQKILDYFAVNHYRVIGKYLGDTENLWFMGGRQRRALSARTSPSSGLNDDATAAERVPLQAANSSRLFKMANHRVMSTPSRSNVTQIATQSAASRQSFFAGSRLFDCDGRQSICDHDDGTGAGAFGM